MEGEGEAVSGCDQFGWITLVIEKHFDCEENKRKTVPDELKMQFNCFVHTNPVL